MRLGMQGHFAQHDDCPRQEGRPYPSRLGRPYVAGNRLWYGRPVRACGRDVWRRGIALNGDRLRWAGRPYSEGARRWGDPPMQSIAMSMQGCFVGMGVG